MKSHENLCFPIGCRDYKAPGFLRKSFWILPYFPRFNLWLLSLIKSVTFFPFYKVQSYTSIFTSAWFIGGICRKTGSSSLSKHFSKKSHSSRRSWKDTELINKQRKKLRVRTWTLSDVIIYACVLIEKNVGKQFHI